MHQATGAFEVQLTPQSDEHTADDVKLGRLLIDKTFTGGLEASSKGQMLSARTDDPSSAGYVAIEKVSGTLAGRVGTFVLQHSSTLERGVPTQSITVVPDSGTGDLVGLAGSMIIRNEDGAHFYDFHYRFDDARAEVR